jgi:uncharacterized protein YwqG
LGSQRHFYQPNLNSEAHRRKMARSSFIIFSIIIFTSFTETTMAQQMGEFPLYKTTSVALPSTREALRASLKTVKMLTPNLISQLSEQALPAILLETTLTKEDALPLGGSKIGGAPDLSKGMPWPGRPPYPDAEMRVEQYRSTIAITLAKAGIAPDWMEPDQGENYVEEQRRIQEDVIEKTLAIMPEDMAVQMRKTLEEQSVYTPQRAREETRDDARKAKLVAEDCPLSFIAQIDLGTLEKLPGFDTDLPKSGRLLLFYDLSEMPAGWDPSAKVGFRLIWDQTAKVNLERVSIPPALSDAGASEKLVLKPAEITPHSIISPIPPSEQAWNDPSLSAASAQQFGEGPYWSYLAWLSQFGEPSDPNRMNHQLGGWPQPLQNGMQAQAELASNGINAGSSEAYQTPKAKKLLEDAGDWKLVLQIGVDEKVGLQAGAYYVLMRRSDILARRFNEAWVVYQSG